MKTLDYFFDAKDIALFMSCFCLNKGDFRDFLPKSNIKTHLKKNKP